MCACLPAPEWQRAPTAVGRRALWPQLASHPANNWPCVLSTCARYHVNLPGFPPFPVSSEKFLANSTVSGFSLCLHSRQPLRRWLWETTSQPLLGRPKRHRLSAHSHCQERSRALTTRRAKKVRGQEVASAAGLAPRSLKCVVPPPVLDQNRHSRSGGRKRPALPRHVPWGR